jgi:hypothetical protein
MPAKIANPQKKFKFRILVSDITGAAINQFLCQKVGRPEEEIDQVPHGDTNFDVKTAGRKKIGNLTIDKLVAADSPDYTVGVYLDTIQNTLLGGGVIPQLYKKVIVVQKLGTDGISIIQSWTYDGCWLCKINGVEYERMSSDNVIESLEFSVDERLPLV